MVGLGHAEIIIEHVAFVHMCDVFLIYMLCSNHILLSLYVGLWAVALRHSPPSETDLAVLM